MAWTNSRTTVANETVKPHVRQFTRATHGGAPQKPRTESRQRNAVRRDSDALRGRTARRCPHRPAGRRGHRVVGDVVRSSPSTCNSDVLGLAGPVALSQLSRKLQLNHRFRWWTVKGHLSPDQLVRLTSSVMSTELSNSNDDWRPSTMSRPASCSAPRLGCASSNSSDNGVEVRDGQRRTLAAPS
jgi:hypothetical protein